MAIVIGFNRPVEHGHTVCAIVDGEFLFASEEKRRTKHKHSPENKSPSLLEEDAGKYFMDPGTLITTILSSRTISSAIALMLSQQ